MAAEALQFCHDKLKGFSQLHNVLKPEQETMSESVLQWFAKKRDITLCTDRQDLKDAL